MEARETQHTTGQPSSSRPVVRPMPLWQLLLPVVVLGGIGAMPLLAMARLSELEYELQRLDRLCQEQTQRREELLRQREPLVSHKALTEYARTHHLVPAPEPRPLTLGRLPEQQVHWQLPGERGRSVASTSPTGAMQASGAVAAPAQGL